LIARQESLASYRSGGIPTAVNLSLALLFIAVNLYQFIVLPLWLLPAAPAWGWTLLPLVLLTNPFWSLIHEAVHDLLHPDRRANTYVGRFLAILFGSPFRILRLSHLLHHKLNRLPVEGTEYYDRNHKSKASAAPGYYFQISFGLYLIEVISPLLFFLPRNWIRRFKDKLLQPESISAILVQNWLGDEALREIRFDGLLTVSWLMFSFLCYGENWPLLLAALVARGFLISFLDNVYHYETPVSDIFYAKNLWLPRPLMKLLLHFNLHGIHHVNPAIPWIHLPKAFAAEAGRFQCDYFGASLHQLRGPIALQDLPHAPSAVRIRPA
jgi:fatty acid desaturase